MGDQTLMVFQKEKAKQEISDNISKLFFQKTMTDNSFETTDETIICYN